MRIYRKKNYSLLLMGCLKFKLDLIKGLVFATNERYACQSCIPQNWIRSKQAIILKWCKACLWKQKKSEWKQNEKWLTVKWNLFKHHKRIEDCAARILSWNFGIWNWSLFHYFVYFGIHRKMINLKMVWFRIFRMCNCVTGFIMIRCMEL